MKNCKRKRKRKRKSFGRPWDGWIRSATEMAWLLHRSPGTITRWMKRDDWTFGAGPWDVTTFWKIVEFRGELQENRDWTREQSEIA